MGEPEEHPITLDGQTLWLSFTSFYNRKETIAMQLSEDGQAIRTLRTFDSNGKLRSYGEVLTFASQGPFGLVPKEVAFRQYDPRGLPYRELKGRLSIRFNDPAFSYFFE